MNAKEAKALRAGDQLVDEWGQKWRVTDSDNTDDASLRVPVRHGLVIHGYVSLDNVGQFEKVPS